MAPKGRNSALNYCLVKLETLYQIKINVLVCCMLAKFV